LRRIVVSLLTAALVVPLAVAAAPPADAATGTLTVITLGRDGRPVAAGLQVADTKALGQLRYLSSGRAHRLPRGTYDILVDIYNVRDDTDTLAARRVRVAGNTKVTLDARRGRAVRARLSPAPPGGYRQHLLMALCQTDGAASVVGWTNGAVLYVVPSSLATLELSFSSIWEPENPESHGDRFLAAATYRNGIPNGVSRTFRQAALTSIGFTARRGPQAGTPLISLSGHSPDNCRSSVLDLRTQMSLPSSYTAHVPAGRWSVSEDGQDYAFGDPREYGAGHRYQLALNRAAWGPAGELPYTWGSGRRLYLNVTHMFTDPVLTHGPWATTTYTLTKGGRAIVRRTVHGDGPALDPVLKSRGWYTLTASAVRHPVHPLPSDTLSTRSTLRLRFYVDPAASRQIRGYVTQFRPVGLDTANRAQAGTTTTVTLVPQRQKPTDPAVRQLSDSVRRVRAWASADGGRTWQAVPVRKAGRGWSAVVRNGQPGYVSLRCTVTDSHADTSTTTVIRAYAVS
jgi:hypothetical protein